MLSIKIINRNKVGIRIFSFLILIVIMVFIFSNTLIWFNRTNYPTANKIIVAKGINPSVLLEVDTLKAQIDTTLPIIKMINGIENKDIHGNILRWMINASAGFDIKRLETIIESEILLMNGHEVKAVSSLARIDESNISNKSLEDIDDNTDGHIEGENKNEHGNENITNDGEEKQEKEVLEKEFPYFGNKYINNETGIDVDVTKLLKEKLTINFAKKGPAVLIIHTHTSESYTPTQNSFYIPSDTDRTEKPEYNVVRVGQEISKTLKEMGIEVIHDKTVHDFPSYKGSYINSLKTVQEIIAKYPSIKFVFDIHRDAFLTEDGKKMKVTTTIEGKKNAQVMFVVGTNSSGLEHPKWRENLKLALKFQERINKLTPGLARLINLTKYRYNQHTTTGSLIIEIGSNGNTLEEALLGCKNLARGIGEIIKENKK